MTTTDRIVGPLGAHDSRWELALCAQIDRDLHHPKSTHPRHAAQIADARQVCARCPLTGTDGPCLARALEEEAGQPLDKREGIVAGTTPQERLAMDKENAT